mmetsp:Transcript_92780/g.161231  ORF Transcript_92780/g.161231 Transcript_92780/m.161231 type:complete len:97 (+) Transcript_92780:3-293(+)
MMLQMHVKFDRWGLHNSHSYFAMQYGNTHLLCTNVAAAYFDVCRSRGQGSKESSVYHSKNTFGVVTSVAGALLLYTVELLMDTTSQVTPYAHSQRN